MMPKDFLWGIDNKALLKFSENCYRKTEEKQEMFVCMTGNGRF